MKIPLKRYNTIDLKYSKAKKTPGVYIYILYIVYSSTLPKINYYKFRKITK